MLVVGVVWYAFLWVWNCMHAHGSVHGRVAGDTRCSESKSLKIEGTVHYFVLQQRVFMMCMEGWLSGGRSVSRHGKPGITAAACG